MGHGFSGENVQSSPRQRFAFQGLVAGQQRTVSDSVPDPEYKGPSPEGPSPERP